MLNNDILFLFENIYNNNNIYINKKFILNINNDNIY